MLQLLPPLALSLLTPTAKRSFIVELVKDDAMSVHSTFVRGRAEEVRA